jgi:hypothetical protein
MKTNSEKVEQFCRSYSGKKLLSKHSMEEYGIWHVHGEDPNPDLVGHHYEPDLGLYEGRLANVVAYAVELPGWYQWGAGGSIKAYKNRKIQKITKESLAELAAKRARKRELEDELQQLSDELEDWSHGQRRR